MGFDMNYKIKVANEVESKEAQELFFALGYSWDIKGREKDYLNIRSFTHLSTFGKYIGQGFGLVKFKEITLPELRDLVVLKRNSIEDATHTGKHGSLWYLGFNKYGWRFDIGDNGEWELDNPKNKTVYFGELKPIEKKEMKEYLVKDTVTGYYFLTKNHSNFVGAIEVPEWASLATVLESGALKLWDAVSFERCPSGYIIWQRESPNDKLASAEQYRQAEVLPFIDDEPKSAWDTQVGGDHYKKYKIQPMLFALENNLNPLQHSVLKYIMRHEDKNGKQDLEKAKHYIDLMIAHYYPAE